MLKLLLVLLGGAKLGKIALSGGTMLISLVAYALVFGWMYAAGFVLLIFVHEMGHYIAARQRGLAVGLPTFIPFVGAWVELKDLPHDVETEAYVGMAGPVIGSLAAFVLYLFAQQYDSRLMYALAYAGFMINLFNLIPMSPLDGGRITAILSPKIWLLGVPVMIGLFIWRPSPMLLLIALIAMPEAWRVLRGQDVRPGGAGYYQVSLRTRVEYGLAYVGLAAALALMAHATHEQLGAAQLHL